ncbi:hypothetical protein [Azoarcus sp. KH32C]|uniref:hypothetical protein n=1 Tax=Azoarcus sp. KH32C TaxID=748247 RepID=UPI0002385FC2|nr:hypothetical protein [Azoarcus sp. KH32C]BAL23485.1 hypothetical protein AZKH_1156 [Azoarcus sp. KH32C]
MYAPEIASALSTRCSSGCALRVPCEYPKSLDEELEELFPELLIGEMGWFGPTSACHVAWNTSSGLSRWLKQLSPARLRAAAEVIDAFSRESISIVSALDAENSEFFCEALERVLERNRFDKDKARHSDVTSGTDEKLLGDFLQLPTEICAILLERGFASSYQVDFLRTSPEVSQWISHLEPHMLDALFEIFHEYFEGSTGFISALARFTSDKTVLDRTDQWLIWALCAGCVRSELAFRIAVTRFDTAEECHEFIILAHDAMLTAEDATEFDTLFEMEDPMDELKSWLRDRVAMHRHIAVARRIRHLLPHS